MIHNLFPTTGLQPQSDQAKPDQLHRYQKKVGSRQLHRSRHTLTPNIVIPHFIEMWNANSTRVIGGFNPNPIE